MEIYRDAFNTCSCNHDTIAKVYINLNFWKNRLTHRYCRSSFCFHLYSDEYSILNGLYIIIIIYFHFVEKYTKKFVSFQNRNMSAYYILHQVLDHFDAPCISCCWKQRQVRNRGPCVPLARVYVWRKKLSLTSTGYQPSHYLALAFAAMQRTNKSARRDMHRAIESMTR